MLLGLLLAAAGGLVAGSLLEFAAGRLRGPERAPPVARRRHAVAVLTGLLFSGVVLAHAGDGPDIVLGLGLATLLVAAALAELEGKRPADPVLAAVAATAVALGTLVDSGGEVERLLCAVGAAGFVLLVALTRPGTTDMDGVKLAAVAGLFLGRDVAVAVLLAVAVRGAVAIVRADRGERVGAPAAGVSARVPLFIGAAGALLIGEPLVDAYLGAF